MANVNVLIVFYSRYGRAEQLALAAGVGAIQARANIRLRRVADAADSRAIESDARWKENLDRMNRDYVVPRDADPAWADVIVLATAADSAIELEAYLDQLRSAGSAAGKIAATLAAENRTGLLDRLSSAARAAGMVVAPAEITAGDPVDCARMYGRQVSELAGARKET